MSGCRFDLRLTNALGARRCERITFVVYDTLAHYSSQKRKSRNASDSEHLWQKFVWKMLSYSEVPDKNLNRIILDGFYDTNVLGNKGYNFRYKDKRPPASSK